MPATLTAPDSEALKRAAQPVIAEAARRLVAEFQPEQVWLFGSYAWGEPDADSDLDFMVVVASPGEKSTLEMMQEAHSCLNGLRMATDIVVKTSAEVTRFKDVRPTLIYKIVREGRLLHG